ncbi:hypothetical protein DL96DRAFT_1780813, partial [Flagelloscypha sp. PMI_526]
LLMRMKGTNGIHPCRCCNITAVRAPAGKTYYTPHERSWHPDNIPLVDLANLPLCTHREVVSHANEVDRLRVDRNETAANEYAKKTGINSCSKLTYLSSIRFPDSFPSDFMHLIFENNLLALIQHWSSDYKGLDDGSESYILEKAVLEAIGRETAEAGSTVPSAYGPRLPNIYTNRSFVTADMWSFWSQYLGPVLLRRHLQPHYFKHFIAFVKLVTVCLQFEMTNEEIENIRIGFIQWVRQYEEYYEVLYDTQERFRNREESLALRTEYGQLSHLFSVTFPSAIPEIHIAEPTTFIYAAIRPCKLLPPDPLLDGLDIHLYNQFHTHLSYIDVQNIQCLVGRVPDGQNWAIIDRSGSMNRAVW